VRASCHQRPARLAVFCLATFVLTLAATAARAASPSTVQGLRSANASLASRSQQALLELYSLQTRLGLAERRVAALEDRTAEVQAEREAAQKQLEQARADFQTAQSQLAERLRQLYIEGDVDPLAVLLGAQSLDEVVSALDGLNRLATQDKQIVAQLARAKASLRTASARLAQREDELNGLLADAKATRASIASARDARAGYLAGLRHQQALNQSQIQRLTAQAAAAESQSEDLTSGSETSSGGSSPTGPPIPPAPPPSGSKLTVSSTGYCLKGNTATGVPTSHGVIAVDPAVIPLGTRMYVPGYGEGVAADTGSAVQGPTIDLWFDTCTQALAWGRRTVTITLH
jgi:3D (Asp-Asp-Asp) domain-containing protein/peptidoglycan hydrolase CwlO-like protein